MAVELDLERVVCRLSELAAGARAFTLGGGNWPLRMFVVRVADTVHGYLNRCPHAGHPLDLLPDPHTLPHALRISPEELESRNNEITRDGEIVLFCT